MRIRRAAGFALALAIPTGAAAGPARHPDFTGVWSTASLTEMERPDEFKTLVVPEAEAAAFEKARRGKPPKFPDVENSVGGPESEWWETDVGLARIRGQVRTSWIVNPADGQIPFTSDAKAANKARSMGRLTAVDGPEARSPDERCIAAAAAPPFENGGSDDNYQFVQTADHLAIHSEWMDDVRVVRIGGATHPPPSVRYAAGDSIGRWDGDTLVIETTNFAPTTVNDPKRDPAADMRIVERLTRQPDGQILYTFAITNPARYTQTWHGEMLLHAAQGRIYEFACHEGNYGLTGILAGAREQERTAAKAASAVSVPGRVGPAGQD